MKKKSVYYIMTISIVSVSLVLLWELLISYGFISFSSNYNKGLSMSYMLNITPVQRDEMLKKVKQLHDASKRGDVEEINSLIKSGVVIDLAFPKGEPTALHLAAMNNHLEACKVLLNAGASPIFTDIVKPDSDGMQPVDYAVKNSRLLEIFLDAGTPVESPGMFGITLIQRAIMEKRPESIELLANRGANLNLGFKVVDNIEMLDLLIKLGAKPSQDDINHIGEMSGNCNKEVLWNQLELYGYKPSNEYRLFLASSNGNSQYVQKLLDLGTNPNIHLDNKRTPLHVAVINKHISCVSILIKAGAKVDALDNTNSTPLLYCVLLCRDSQIVKVLLEAGADPSIRNVHNQSALSIAKKRKNKELYELLKPYENK
ncbi:MAG: ankyrin repeat domain-containing protein [Thermoguttaceae bacterium]|nr:ankyrin repeat domain-containing protein [Thermoguttaceae bacterium]